MYIYKNTHKCTLNIHPRIPQSSHARLHSGRTFMVRGTALESDGVQLHRFLHQDHASLLVVPQHALL